MTPDTERLEAMLTRLQLTAVRDRLDSLLFVIPFVYQIAYWLT